MNQIFIKGNLETIREVSSKLFFIKLRTLNNLSNSRRIVQFVAKEPDLIEKIKNCSRESFIECFSTEREDSEAESWILKDIKLIQDTNEIPPVGLGQKEIVPASITNLKIRSNIEHKKILIRARTYEFIRFFLNSKNFVEYDCPKITESVSESGADLFELNNCTDGKKRYLIQSPQLYKQRLINAGFEGVYEIGHIFRNEKFNTSRHMYETTCLDLEKSTQDPKELRDLITELLIELSVYLNKNFGLEIYSNEDFCTIDYEDAIKLLGPDYLVFDRTAEKDLVKLLGKKFVYVINYPNQDRPFYTRGNTGFDLLHDKCEILSGSVRITDPNELATSAKLKSVNLDTMGAYRDSFKVGCGFSTGLGLGLDRLLMVLMNLDCVQDTLYF